MISEKSTVEIRGRKYEVDIEGLTPIEAGALADFVNQRMNDVEKASNIVDTSRIAVLTALNLADELLRLRATHEELNETLSKRVSGMIKILEAALGVKEVSQGGSPGRESKENLF